MPEPVEQPSFLAEFAAALRYVLQQHERAILARARYARGDVGAIADANHYECLIEEGAQRLALIVLERDSAHDPTGPPARADDVPPPG